MQRIHADLLIPGRGEPVDGGIVVMDQGHISYAGPAAGAPPRGNADVVEAAVAMPGMWDCHAHFTGSRSLDPLRWALEPTATAGARSVIDARSALRAGITSVREVPTRRSPRPGRPSAPRAGAPPRILPPAWRPARDHRRRRAAHPAARPHRCLRAANVARSLILAPAPTSRTSSHRHRASAIIVAGSERPDGVDAHSQGVGYS